MVDSGVIVWKCDVCNAAYGWKSEAIDFGCTHPLRKQRQFETHNRIWFEDIGKMHKSQFKEFADPNTHKKFRMEYGAMCGRRTYVHHRARQWKDVTCKDCLKRRTK